MNWKSEPDRTGFWWCRIRRRGRGTRPHFRVFEVRRIGVGAGVLMVWRLEQWRTLDGFYETLVDGSFDGAWALTSRTAVDWWGPLSPPEEEGGPAPYSYEKEKIRE